MGEETIAKPGPKSMKEAKAKKPVSKSTNSTFGGKTSAMVLSAIENLKEMPGSSLASIKHYIDSNYEVDVAKSLRSIQDALVKGVKTKTLIRSKGKLTTTGLFRIAKKAAEKLKKTTVKSKVDLTKKKEKAPKSPKKSEKAKKEDKPKNTKSVKSDKKDKTKSTKTEKKPKIEKKTIKKLTADKKATPKKNNLKKEAKQNQLQKRLYLRKRIKPHQRKLLKSQILKR